MDRLEREQHPQDFERLEHEPVSASQGKGDTERFAEQTYRDEA